MMGEIGDRGREWVDLLLIRARGIRLHITVESEKVKGDGHTRTNRSNPFFIQSLFNLQWFSPLLHHPRI